MKIFHQKNTAVIFGIVLHDMKTYLTSIGLSYFSLHFKYHKSFQI